MQVLIDAIARLVKWLSEHKDFFASVQNLVTIFAILFGGGWALRRFRKERPYEPSLLINVSVSVLPLNSKQKILHINALIRNLGHAVFKVCNAPSELDRMWFKVYGIDESNAKNAYNQCQMIDWQHSGIKLFEGWFEDTPGLVLEAGEQEPAAADITIPANIRIVHIWVKISDNEWFWSANKTFEVSMHRSQS